MLSIVIWIGGVSFVTTVILPVLRRGTLGTDRLRAFAAVESRFVWQARAAVLIAGASGLYLLWRLVGLHCEVAAALPAANRAAPR